MKHQLLTALAITGIVTAGCNQQSPDIDGSTTNPSDKSWAVFDEEPSGRANQSVVVNGEFIGTDEIHFARGANVDNTHHEFYWAPGGQIPEVSPTPNDADEVYRHSTWGAFGADRAAHNGDYMLPSDTTNWPDFTGDLAFLRMEADSTDLYLHVRFVSFPNDTAQIATITFKEKTTSPALTDWPQNAGIKSTYSHAVTMHGSGAILSTSGIDSDIATLGGASRITDHAFEARIPLASLPAGPWMIGAGTGLADPDDTSQYWTVIGAARTATTPGTDTGPSDNQPLGSNVWDLAFTPHDPLFHDDHIQGDLLRDLDVSTAVTEVDPAILQARGNVEAPVITGRIAHTYQSAFDFGDGITRGAAAPVPDVSAGILPTSGAVSSTAVPRDTAVSYEYTGAMQPYFAYIPSNYDASQEWPLILYFHGLNNYIWEPFGLTIGIEEYLENRGYLFASLLGRGDISFSGPGELDPLEVIEHMAARYNIDRQRIYIVGHSHGGASSVRVTKRNPDKFAAVVSTQITETLDLAENYRHLPSIQVAGAGDPIDSGASAQARYNALSALGYDAQAIVYSLKTHENSSIYDTLDEIFDLYDRSVAPLNPAEVIFTRAGNDFNEELGLLHNSAYWVWDMVAVDAAQNMTIHAISNAIPYQPLDVANATASTNPAFDSEGNSATTINGDSGRTNGTHYQTVPAFLAETTAENTANLTTSNISEMTLDTDRMSLDFTSEVQLNTDLSAPLILKLSNTGKNTLLWVATDFSGSETASATSNADAGIHSLSLPVSTTRIIIQ